MATEVGIANAALRKIGAETISSFTQGNKNANLANERFDEVRDHLLSIHPWNFAIKRAKLGRLSSTPAFEWTYEYALPADHIATVTVHGTDAGGAVVEYKEEDGMILSDSADIYMRYVARIEDPNQMPAYFRETFADHLATEFAIPIVNSNTLKEQVSIRAATSLRRARSRDALADRPDKRPRGSWVGRRS